MQTAQLLENDSHDCGERFTVSLGNIPINCDFVVTRIKYLTRLDSDGEQNSWRFIVPTRYKQNVENYQAVSYFTKPSSSSSSLVDFEVDINIEGSNKIKSVESINHTAPVMNTRKKKNS
eukprot:snap_masked-scaffold_20-processed-gene-1.18-mRNA-1 protein AED:1.00 eAED:1.00 QI:0/-1/0/0/-1/1/1/0/118